MDLSLSRGNRLSVTPPEGAVERELWEKGMTVLFADGETLYGMHPYTGQIFRIRDRAAEPYARIPEEQFFYTDREELRAKQVISALTEGGTLYLVLESFTREKG